jgi:hypothetical protein
VSHRHPRATGDDRLMFPAEVLSLMPFSAVGQPMSAEDAVARPCCGAAAGKRRGGATVGWLDGAKSRGWEDVCPDRRRAQEALR